MDLLVDLCEIDLPVLDAEVHHSAMDVVKGSVIGPLLVNIVDEECDVGRNPGRASVVNSCESKASLQAWLDRRQVDANDLDRDKSALKFHLRKWKLHLRLRMLVAEIYGPNACACANIEDSADLRSR